MRLDPFEECFLCFFPFVDARCVVVLGQAKMPTIDRKQGEMVNLLR